MKVYAKHLLHVGRGTMIGFVILLTTCFLSLPSKADVIDLGNAANYAVLNPGALGTSSTGPTNLMAGTINGNVGQGPGASWNFVRARVNGRIDNGGTTFPGTLSPGVVTGGVFTVNMTPTGQSAATASTTAAGISATQTFTSLTNGQVITGTPGLNVIRITNPVSLTNTSLTLQGNLLSQFLFQLPNAANSFNNVTMTLTGGVAPANILWDVNGTAAGTSFGITINSGSLFGTFLAPFRSVQVLGGAQVLGQIIGGGANAQTIGSSALTINGAATTITLAPPPPPIPEPGTLTMMGTGAIGLLGMVRRKLRRA